MRGEACQRCLLLADDDLIGLSEAAHALAPLGLPLVHAVGAAQALRLARAAQPALIVAALPLGGMSGPRLVAALLPLGTPVLLLSRAVLAPELGARVSFAPASLSQAALRAITTQLLSYRNRSSSCEASPALTP